MKPLSQMLEEENLDHATLKRVAIELAKAIGKISVCNKNYTDAPKENRGPSSKEYWMWQEEQSRDIADDALSRAKDIIGGDK